MTGILEAVGAGGAASGAEAGAGATTAGATGTASAAGAGTALTGLGGMGPEASLGTTPSFGSQALPTNQAMMLQRAGEMGNPSFASAASPDVVSAGSAGHMLPANTAKGGGGGYGEAMKSLTSGQSGQAAMDLMKIAASRKSGGGTIPSLPQRQGGGGTQPSAQEFLKMLGQRRGPMMGAGR